MAEPFTFASLAVQRPANGPNEENLASLGETLFKDKRLSSKGSVSCATCHAGTSTTDGKARAVGLGTGTRNTPAILNRAYATHQMMDGRAPSLEAQALLPIQSSKEMGMTFSSVLAFLKGDPTYSKELVSAFGLRDGNAITIEHFARTLAAYERTLVSPANAPAVRSMALAADARAGRALFFGKAQCATCHSGPNLSDEQFHNTGFAVGEGDDPGLAARSFRASDRGKLKTPGLRNVKNTGPYFHDGSATSLQAVVDFYNRGGNSASNRDPDIHPLGLTTAEVGDLVAFLEAL
jgi:cytochrome c peroxidase